MADVPRVNLDDLGEAPAPAKPRKTRKTRPSGSGATHRNWTFFTAAQQLRFHAAQERKGIRGPALLSMIFNEWADREGL